MKCEGVNYQAESDFELAVDGEVEWVTVRQEQPRGSAGQQISRIQTLNGRVDTTIAGAKTGRWIATKGEDLFWTVKVRCPGDKPCNWVEWMSTAVDEDSILNEVVNLYKRMLPAG